MIGFKGNLPKTVTNGQSLFPIFKFAQENRKASQYCSDFFMSITKFQQIRANFNMKIISESTHNEFNDKFNKNLWEIIIKIVSEYKSLWENTKLCTQSTSTVCNEAFSNLSVKITQLEESIASYVSHEDLASELGKKYYKIHKNMLTAIDQYKASFSDVNLIYNIDEKIRRYQLCQTLYKNALQQFNAINHECVALQQLKNNVINMFQIVQVTQNQTIKRLGQHYIQTTKKCMECFHLTTKNIKLKLNQYQNQSQVIHISSLFKSPLDLSMLQCFNQKQKINITIELPIFIEYHHLLKQDYFTMYNIQIETYISLIQNRVEKKKIENKKIFQNVSSYFKNIQKIQNAGAKEILINFQKKRKKISECFGNRFISFLKSLNSVFQISTGVNEKLLKNINSILTSIQNSIKQDSKLLKLFLQQTKQNIDRFVLKKQINKPTKDQTKQKQNNQLQQAIDLRLARKELSQKAQFLKHLITGFKQKMDKNQMKLITYYNDLMSTVSNSNNQFFSFCNQYLELYFGAKQFEGNFQKYSIDLQNTLQKNSQYLKQTPFGNLKTSNLKMSFDGQFNKIQDFKKLKKPSTAQVPNTYIQINLNNQNANKSKPSSLSKPNQQEEKSMIDARNLIQDQKQIKNAQFLRQKIIFKESEKLIKTYSCALAQKIVLQGKIYITNHRVCFHSNFNSENIFFGRTFIQFPKTDIKKIQKRKNSLFLDNSITFTTINGEVSFTSFFSRNQAYDLICKTFNFNLDDHVYEYREVQAQKLPQFLLDFQEKDDISINGLQQRKLKIEEDLKKLHYQSASSIQINQEGLNALKIFKIIYSSKEVTINGKKYEHFLKYIKECVHHTDLEVDEWVPSLNLILNQSNIKQNAPIKSQRKLRMTVPIANTGVPFMPKTAKSEQIQTLYFYSKHKFVLLSSIASKGAPLTDTFNIELKTIVQSTQEGKCKVSIEHFIDFIKHTVMKNMIDKKSKQQSCTNSRIWTTQIKKYFQSFSLKHAKKVNRIKSLQSMKQQCENTENSLKNVKSQNTALVNKIQALNGQVNKWQKIAKVSIALNILIILIFFII